MTLEATLLLIGAGALIAWFFLHNTEEPTSTEPEKSDPPTMVVTDEGSMEVPAAAPAKMTAKKETSKKTATKKAKVDLDSMSKNDLLAHAKANGVKANASMNKAAILEAIKNG